MRAVDITCLATQLIGRSRAEMHGDILEVHHAIAAVWNGILAAAGKPSAKPLDAHDVANLMEGLKIARRYNGALNMDDYADGAGYAALAGEIAHRLMVASEHLKQVAAREGLQRRGRSG